MKNLYLVLVLFSAFLFASCSSGKSSIAMGELDGACFPNKTCNEGLTCDEESNLCVKIELQDDSDSTADTDSENTDPDIGDSAEDTDTTPDDTDSDTDQGRKQGELYGECYPNNTCNEGLICDTENNICIKDPNSQNDDDNDMTIDDDADSDTGDDDDDDNDDTDTVIELTEEEKCIAAEGSWNEADSSCTKTVDCADKPEHSEWNGNSAYTLEYITGEWTETIETEYNEEVGTCKFKCEEHYFWNGYICVNPCDSNPCLQVTNSNEECTGIDAAVFSCGCLEHYTWTASTLTCDADSQLMECGDIPENAAYNTVSGISQTWNGEDWFPSNESYFSETPSETECRFKCDPDYVWTGSMCKLPTPCDSNPCADITNSTEECSLTDGNYVCGCIEHYYWTGSLCEAEQQVKPCTGKPENSSWNTAESITQTWNGTDWTPSTTGVYNTTASTSECRYKCNTNYSWNSSNSTCVVTTQQGNCSSKPANTVWNDNGKNGKFDQTWNGSTYTPASYTSTYNTTAGICRYKCGTNYTWDKTNLKCKANSKVSNCTGLPSNADWNTVSTISQTWNGSSWQPTTTASYNATASTAYCRFKCVQYFKWDGSKCVIDSDSQFVPVSRVCTGQTKCYNNSGTITCPTSSSADFFGQDAYYASLGYCAPQNFSLEGSNASRMVVVDNNTGLMWQQTTLHSATSPSKAEETYCSQYTYGGYSDWRLPTIPEILSIVDNGRNNPAANTTYFPDTSGYFWVAETYHDKITYTPAQYRDYAFRASLQTGKIIVCDMTNNTCSAKVMCVREQ